MNNSNPIFSKILIGVSLAALLFHFTIVLGVIPYEITWGGRLKSVEEMYVFETVSILVNSFFIYVVLQKGNFVKPVFSRKALSVILWVFFAIFMLNTIGNLFAQTTFEKGFTIVTLLSAFLIWKINRR
ncbi:MAG: hypothetical protein JNJ57_07400 [Saprospiraceae bacterium]|nr:hypothetical protein [Saprospiraceae bacterium]